MMELCMHELHKVKGESFGLEASTPKKKVYYPSFSVELGEIPEAKNWEVGKTYQVVLEVIQKALRIDDKREEVTFEVRKIGAMEHENKAKPSDEMKKRISTDGGYMKRSL